MKIRLLWPISLLPIILFIATLIRIQNLPSLEEQYLLGTDSYRFFRQAQIIASEGNLPERDMMRWVPLGRSLSQHLNLLSYILAYTFKILHPIIPSLTIFQVATLSSVVFFSILLVAVYIVASQIFNKRVALLSASLLAILDSVIVLSRSCAGFADRDSLSLLLGVSTLGCYLKHIQTPILRDKIIWNSCSAVFMILLGLTWKGCVFFIIILTGLNLIRFLFYTNRKQDILFFLGWFLPIVAGLLLFTDAYRGGANTSSPFATMVFLPPIWLILMSSIHLIISRNNHLVRILTLQARLPLHIAVFMSFSALTLITVSFLCLTSASFHQHLTLVFNNFLVPLGKSRLMQAIMELTPPNLFQWVSHYRALFFCFLGGIFVSLYSLGKSLKVNSWIPMSLCGFLFINLFYRQEINAILKNQAITLFLYLGSIFLLFVGIFGNYVGSHWKQNKTSQNDDKFTVDSGIWLLFLWCIISLFLARGAIRYDFFFTPIVLIYAAYALDLIFKWFAPNDRNDYIFLSTILITYLW